MGRFLTMCEQCVIIAIFKNRAGGGGGGGGGGIWESISHILIGDWLRFSLITYTDQILLMNF